jgi:CRP-like cAMP-binding protein
MEQRQFEQLSLFQGLDSESIGILSSHFKDERFDKDSVIFAQGDRAEKLYVLITGQVAIRFKPHDGDLLTVSEINDGGVFGWSSALGRSTYTSSAICIQDCTALSVKGDQLHDLCEKYPQTGVIILERLAEVIAQRLQNTHAQVVKMLQEGVQSTGTEDL